MLKTLQYCYSALSFLRPHYSTMLSFFINFFLSLFHVCLLPKSLLSPLSFLIRHTISPKLLPLPLTISPKLLSLSLSLSLSPYIYISFFFFFLCSHWFSLLLLIDGSWIMAEICSDLMDVVGLIWWIMVEIRFDFFSGISDGG